MEKEILVSVLIILVVAFATASVFAYYPLQLTVTPVSPPIKFELGINANENDLGDTISVTPGSNKTQVEISIHPTYHTTYYKNVTLLNNTDSKAYNVHLILDERVSTLPSGYKVYLIVFEKGATRDLQPGYPEPGQPSSYVQIIDLSTIGTNSPTLIGELGNGDVWEFDFKVYIPEGYSIENAQATFKMHVVYTPSSDTPP